MAAIGIAFSLPAFAQNPGYADSLNLAISGADSSSGVWGGALQPDGKIVVFGNFTSVAGASRRYIARINASGSIDAAFDPSCDNIVTNALVQPDGKIIIGGNFTQLKPNGSSTVVSRSGLARLNPDGSVDQGFNVNVSGSSLASVDSIALQADGKILIGGDFRVVSSPENQLTRNCVARLNTDGSLDSGFDPNVTGGSSAGVSAIAVQADGKILIGGNFTTLKPSVSTSTFTRNRIARLNPDGGVDSFDPNVGVSSGGGVNCLAVQADGKVLLGGSFISLKPNGSSSAVSRINLARVHSSGLLDDTFTAVLATASVNAFALQADGSFLAGGTFVNYYPNSGGQLIEKWRVAKLSSAGAVSLVFDPAPNAAVFGLSLQPDGKVLVSGLFQNLLQNPGPQISRNYFVRLGNGSASQSFEVPSTSSIIWRRSGAAPEVTNVTFEVRPTGSSAWIKVGSGTRIGSSADWRVDGIKLPGAGAIRAQGQVPGDAAGMVEYIADYSVNAPEIELRGKALPISNGDNSPRIADDSDFGYAQISAGTQEHVFSIHNLGQASLAIGTPSVGGAHPASFSISAQPSPSVAASSFTQFRVRFNPDVSGIQRATISIPNGDFDESPYTFDVVGWGVTPIEDWRLVWFGAKEGLGNSADLADPDGDGLVNLMEYALHGDPLAGSVSPSFELSQNRGWLVLKGDFGRPDLTLTVQAATDPSSGWEDLAKSSKGGGFSTDIAGVSIVENADPETVKISDRLEIGEPSRFLRLKVELSQ